jgi:hypothetical protein
VVAELVEAVVGRAAAVAAAVAGGVDFYPAAMKALLLLFLRGKVVNLKRRNA